VKRDEFSRFTLTLHFLLFTSSQGLLLGDAVDVAPAQQNFAGVDPSHFAIWK
jgi:hypothetical protein